jgi:hypothetical protein
MYIILFTYYYCVFYDRWQNYVMLNYTHTEITQHVRNKLSWKCQALICSNPICALQVSTNLPFDIINSIIVDFIGPFHALPRNSYEPVIYM